MTYADWTQANTLQGQDFYVLLIASGLAASFEDLDALFDTFPELADSREFEWKQAKALRRSTPGLTFAATFMAAYLRADDENRAALYTINPALCTEAANRYEAPGGLLAGDPA